MRYYVIFAIDMTSGKVGINSYDTKEEAEENARRVEANGFKCHIMYGSMC